MRNLSKTIAAIGMAIFVTTALGQYSAIQSRTTAPIYQKPQSYSDYYNQQLKAYPRPQASAYQYTYDRYFYRRPTLSPYLNLTRRTDSDMLNNYYRYVRPELERRETAGFNELQRERAAQTSALAANAPITPPADPGHRAMTNPYFDRYYNLGAPTKLAPPPTPLPPKYDPLPKLDPLQGFTP